MDTREQDIEARARELFDQSVERLDGHTRSRLTQARHAALAELQRPRLRFAGWMPVGATAAVALLAVMVWTQPGPGVGPGESGAVVAAAPADDFELLTLGEDLDMLDEDVEFYAWVTMNEAGNGIG